MEFCIHFFHTNFNSMEYFNLIYGINIYNLNNDLLIDIASYIMGKMEPRHIQRQIINCTSKASRLIARSKIT